MRLRDQVCSFTQAKELKALGARQNSLFYWAVEMWKGIETNKWSLVRKEHILPARIHPKVSAFTVAELGKMLPAEWGEVVHNYNKAVIWIEKIMGDDMKSNWQIRYFGQGSDLIHQENSPFEASCRAKMLIYLLKNEILKGGE